MTTEHISESGENLSETQRLTTRIHDLSTSISHWNDAYMVLVALTVVLAVGVFIAQFVAGQKAKLLAVAQDSLIAEKDRIAKADAKAQDGEIAAAQKQAGESNKAAADALERAGNAEKGAAEARERAAKAQGSLALAEQHSAEANAKAEGFRADIASANASAAQATAQVAEAQRAAAEANRIAEGERLARMQLEARLADRVITPDQKKRIMEAFVLMKGQTVDVVIVGDNPETGKTANELLGCLQSAGLLLNFFHPMQGGAAQGIVVGIREDASPAQKQAASMLVSILKETIGGGVGTAPFEQIMVAGTGNMGGMPGATAVGVSPFRLQIAPK